MTEFGLGLGFDATTVGVIAAMAVVTYATKASGLWALGRVDLSDRTRDAVETLPGAVVVAILAPELLSGGPPAWAAGVAVVVVARRTGNVLLSLGVGLVAVVAFRALL